MTTRKRSPTFGDTAEQLRRDQLDDFRDLDTIENNRYEQAMEQAWRNRIERAHRGRNAFENATTLRNRPPSVRRRFSRLDSPAELVAESRHE